MSLITFNITDHTGHTTLEFDRADATQVDAAMAKFKALLGEGHTAATRKAGATDYSVVKDPEKIGDETVFLRPLQGG